MNQLQQLPRPQLQERGEYAGPLAECLYLQRYEAALLAKIFRRNGREDGVETATPPGYRYEREDVPFVPIDADGPIVQVAAHPGDGPDFFYATYLQMATNARYCNEYHEILLTDGEGGVDGWSPERTRPVRIEEAYAGAEVVGSTLHFLGYPDGALSSLIESKRKRLVSELAEMLGDIQPALLVVHPPKNDHPDHATSFLLTLAALESHAQAGRRVPTLLMHDVEFGLQQESLYVPHAIDDPYTQAYPMHSPGLIVDISATHEAAQCALHKHKTQMVDPVHGQPKVYADLIDTLAQIRGLQLMPEGAARISRGQGFSHVVIPGVTSEHNIVSLRLPEQSISLMKRFNCHQGAEA